MNILEINYSWICNEKEYTFIEIQVYIFIYVLSSKHACKAFSLSLSSFSILCNIIIISCRTHINTSIFVRAGVRCSSQILIHMFQKYHHTFLLINS